MNNISAAIDALNLAYQNDPVALRAMLINVVPCNEVLAEQHPTIPCGRLETGYTLSALGMLNGVLAALDLPRIAAQWSDQADARGQYRLLGFLPLSAATWDRE